MDWFKDHADTLSIIASLVASLLWINTQFNEIKIDIAVIKTVLIMKQIVPCELAKDKGE